MEWQVQGGGWAGDISGCGVVQEDELQWLSSSVGVGELGHWNGVLGESDPGLHG